MTRLLLHHEGSFLEWSEMLDAPVTTGMGKDEIIQYLCDEGRDLPTIIKAIEQAAQDGVARLDVDKSGKNPSFHEILMANRAGSKKTHQDPRQIINELFVERESLF